MARSGRLGHMRMEQLRPLVSMKAMRSMGRFV